MEMTKEFRASISNSERKVTIYNCKGLPYQIRSRAVLLHEIQSKNFLARFSKWVWILSFYRVHDSKKISPATRLRPYCIVGLQSTICAVPCLLLPSKYPVVPFRTWKTR